MESRKAAVYTLAAYLIAAAVIPVSAVDDSYMDVQWSHATKASVDQVYAGDLNGDGFKEVVAAASYTDLRGNSVGWVYLLDRDGKCIWTDNSGNPKCFQETPGAISALTVDDLDGDGKKEIMAGVGYSIQFMDMKGGLQKMYLPDHLFRVESIIVDDLDGDGSKEIIIGCDSLDKGKVFVYNSEKGKKWIAQTPKGSITSAHVSDLDGDGLKEVVVGASTKRGESQMPGYVYVYGAKGEELWNYQTEKGVRTLNAEDVDGDGLKEVLVGAQEKFYSLSSRGELKGSTVTGSDVGVQLPIRSIIVADVNKDGSMEILLGSNDVYALNRDYSRKWISKAGVETYDMKYSDVNNDGTSDILAAGEKLFFIDLDGNEAGTFALNKTMFSLTSLFITDLNEDGFQEIITGCVDGNVYVLRSGILDKSMGATRLYNKAMDMNVAGNYTEARNSAQSARKIYEELGNFPGAKEKIKTIDELLKRISENENKTANERSSADEYYNKAQQAYIAHDYYDAYINAQKAKAVYQSASLSDRENAERCNQIINPSAEALKSDAESSYENASMLHSEGDYANASIYVSRALRGYNAINDADGMENSRKLSDKISEKTIKKEDAENETDYLVQISLALSGIYPVSSTLEAAVYALSAAVLALTAYVLLKNRRRNKPVVEIVDRKQEIGRRRAAHVTESVVDDMERDRRVEHAPRQHAKKEAHEEPGPAQEQSEGHHAAHEKTHDSLQGWHRPKDFSGRKILPKVTRDGFRAEGVSLRGLSCAGGEEDLSD